MTDGAAVKHYVYLTGHYWIHSGFNNIICMTREFLNVTRILQNKTLSRLIYTISINEASLVVILLWTGISHYQSEIRHEMKTVI